MMNAKARSTTTDTPKTEVGEIDTRAPFESVKAAVSLFGEVAFSGERSASTRQRTLSNERALATETKLLLAQKELSKYKEKLDNAETTRIQALSELDKAKKEVEDLTVKLNNINESKEKALRAADAAKNQTKQLEEVKPGEQPGNVDSSELELDGAREQYAIALSELDAAKQELRLIRKEFETSMEAKIIAIDQEIEAKQQSDANKEKQAQLARDIVAVKESLLHVKLATEEVQEEELKICSEKKASSHCFQLALQEYDSKLASLRKTFDPELHENSKTKLEETETGVRDIQKQIEAVKALNEDCVAMVNAELDTAKGVLQRVAEEDSSLHNEVEFLKQQLESVKNERSEHTLKDAEAGTHVGDLHMKLQKCKSELDSAMSVERRARSSSDNLMPTLSQLSAETQSAQKSAEILKTKAEELRGEADASRLILADAERKLQVALREAEEAKKAEARALAHIKELSDETNAAYSLTSESGAKITISREEFVSLSRKVEESEKLTEMKLAAAMAQVEAIRASENEMTKRLEAMKKEMADMEAATQGALKRAEMADAAKKAIEGELTRLREKVQTTSHSNAKISRTTTLPPIDKNDRKENRTPLKKSLLPSLSGFFHRRKSSFDGSYSPTRL
ncbi:WEB family protein [Apostasia shenzhenica]|uniref:WEB family protein n=1 Tax=Apostasia shenzhenica TaxID=1088818 RepID=A0A2H9ZW76_9ASPA|nr:WEB family protein [Apostasia shenzhenica]